MPETPSSPSETTAKQHPVDAAPDEPPGRLLARLFAVPLLIVVMIVGCSVIVVLLFGWISTAQQESIDVLVTEIEGGSGEKVLGVGMLPRDREVWQAAMELARRLDAPDPQDLPDNKKPEIAGRLAAVLERSRAAEQAQMGQELQQFLLTALGKLGQPASTDVLISFAMAEGQPVNVRVHALGGLVRMRHVEAARRRVIELAPLLDAPSADLRLAAVGAIGSLATPGDAQAIDLLADAYRRDDRDVAWNAALFLAKLGSPIAVPQLRDMLSRAYWEQIQTDVPNDPTRKLPLVPERIDHYLKLAIDAAAALGAPELQPAVRDLADDPSFSVRDHAAKAMKGWPAAKRDGETER